MYHVDKLKPIAGDLKVTNGKASFQKNEGTVAFVFNWDNAQWDNKMSVKEQWNDEYDKYVTEGEKAFVAGYVENSKKMSVVDDATTANYIVTVEFTNFDYFFSAMSFVPGHKHKVWANFVVVNTTTGEEECRIVAKEFKGGRDTVKFDSYTEMMNNLGKEFAKCK